jgi:hypothetical protein
MNSLSPSAIASKLESTKNALFTEENKEKAKKFAVDIKNELLRTEDELKMQKILDLLKGRIVWSKNYWTDFWYNLRNNHPLIGCFLADPVHPFSRGERMVVLAMSLGVAYIITVMGVYYSDLWSASRLFIGIILSSLIQTIVDSVLVSAATCSCCYGPRIPVAVTTFFEVQGKMFLCWNFTVIFVLMGLMIHFFPQWWPDIKDQETGLNPLTSETFYAKWLLAKLLSWLWGLPMAVVSYHCSRSSQIKKNPEWEKGAILNKEGVLLGSQVTETRVVCVEYYPLKVHTQVAVVASPKGAGKDKEKEGKEEDGPKTAAVFISPSATGGGGNDNKV